MTPEKPFGHQHADGRICRVGDFCPDLGRIGPATDPREQLLETALNIGGRPMCSLEEWGAALRLALRAIPEAAALRVEVDRLNAYVQKSIADTGRAPAGELLRADEEMASEHHAEMEALRADLAKAKDEASAVALKLDRALAERDELLKALRYANDRLQPVESSLVTATKRVAELEQYKHDVLAAGFAQEIRIGGVLFRRVP